MKKPGRRQRTAITRLAFQLASRQGDCPPGEVEITERDREIEEAAKRIFETEIAFGDQQYKRDQPYELRWEHAKEQNLFCYRLAMAQAKAALEEAPPT